MTASDKIRWAPKVQRHKIRLLYENDARGILDEVLLEDVGLALLDRCRSVILVSRAEVECPRCGTVIAVGFGRPDPDAPIPCPGADCGWSTTARQWHASWAGRQLNGSRALPVFEKFADEYPRAADHRQRLLLIDQLLHAFHWLLGQGTPGRSVANNLIEGSHAQVLELLDGLAYGDAAPPDQAAEKERWRLRVEEMWQARRSGRPGE